MRKLARLLSRWPLLVAALITAGIVHIFTVFAIPHLSRSDGVTQIQRMLPLNAFVLFPGAKAGSQVLPYQLPDTRYAFCRFDLRDGPIVVRATLAEPGWMLTAYAPGGLSFYSMPAPEQRRLNVNLLILPGGERFLGPMHDARALDQDTSQITAPARTGLIAIQAPLKGRTYAAEIESVLSQASCRKLSY